MKQVMMINGAQRWNMVNEQGETIKGGRITVQDDQLLDTPDKKGKFDTPFNVPYEMYESLNHVPGLYELTLSMKVGSKGQFAVSGVRYVGDSKETSSK